MNRLSEYDEVSVTMWRRGRTATGPHSPGRLIENLDKLAGSGAIEELSVNVWNSRIRRRPKRSLPGTERQIRERIDEFRKWAKSNGYSLAPAFQWNTTSSLIDDKKVEVIVLPVCCLEIRSRGSLVAIFPHATGDETQTVWDGIEQLQPLKKRSSSDVSKHNVLPQK